MKDSAESHGPPSVTTTPQNRAPIPGAQHVLNPVMSVESTSRRFETNPVLFRANIPKQTLVGEAAKALPLQTVDHASSCMPGSNTGSSASYIGRGGLAFKTGPGNFI